MELRQMDYAVYGYVYKKEKGFVDYLKGVDGGGLVRPYAVNPTDAWKLVETLLNDQFTVQMEKTSATHRCVITRKDNILVKGIGESSLLSIAICLAILDISGEKKKYVEEAEQTVEEYERQRQEKEERLHRVNNPPLTF